MTDDTPSERGGRGAPTRRRLLAVAGGAAIGLAGCTGDGSDGGGGPTVSPTDTDTGTPVPTDTETVSPTETAALSCDEMDTGGYERYDESESPFVATFEYPAGESGSEGVALTACVNGERGLTVRTLLGQEPFDIIPNQELTGVDSRTAAMRGEVDGLRQVGELQYGGESLPLVRSTGGSNEDDEARYQTAYPYYVVGLPYDGSEGRTYYRFDLRATVSTSDRLEPTDCGETWAAVSERMIRSLEPNPDTTVEQQDEC